MGVGAVGEAGRSGERAMLYHKEAMGYLVMADGAVQR